MKNVILVLLSCFLFCCTQSTPKEYAENAVKRALSKEKEYKSLFFGQVDSLFLGFNYTRNGKQFVKKYLSEDANLELVPLSNSNGLMTDEYLRHLETGKKIDSMLLNFEPIFYGYSIKHRWQSKDRLGNLLERDSIFVLDSNFSVVEVDTILIKEN